MPTVYYKKWMHVGPNLGCPLPAGYVLTEGLVYKNYIHNNMYQFRFKLVFASISAM